MNSLTNNRWWTYQSERFPILAHGPLVIVFVLSVMLFSSLQQNEIPDLYRIVGAAISALIFFLQLRIADEHKDFDDDARWRPHRAVPRGLVSLPELARLAIAGAVIQFLIAISIDIGLVPILFGVWLFIGLMTVEFFASSWLKRNPSVYLISHMLVMPLIAFYVSAFDWLCECREMPGGLASVMALAFFCGLVLEIGRKIRPPAEEQQGVDTYSSAWGYGRSLLIWVLAILLSVSAYQFALGHVGAGVVPSLLGVVAIVIAVVIAVLLPRTRKKQSSHRNFIEAGSGLVAMALYLGLGPIQWLLA